MLLLLQMPSRLPLSAFMLLSLRRDPNGDATASASATDLPIKTACLAFAAADAAAAAGLMHSTLSQLLLVSTPADASTMLLLHLLIRQHVIPLADTHITCSLLCQLPHCTALLTSVSEQTPTLASFLRFAWTCSVSVYIRRGCLMCAQHQSSHWHHSISHLHSL